MMYEKYMIIIQLIIDNVISGPLFKNEGYTSRAATFGKYADISNICTFGYYEWVCYRDNEFFPEIGIH